MIDFARITVHAGDGGRGSGSFHRVKSRRRKKIIGKADGGDGGDGGNVYIEASAHLSTLEAYRFVKDYEAPNGKQGLSRLRRGARGTDLVLKVPAGTIVRLSTVDSEQSTVDLIATGQRELVAKGGTGGKGNAKLRDEFRRRPRVGEVGSEGEQKELELELKLIADIGLIGLPNAGKSTLLAKLTNARPEIAAYPFTTLEPNLGVLSTPSSSRFTVHSSPEKLKKGQKKAINNKRLTINDSRLVIADIPGLIEGASRGKGLGDLFLRHIERTKALFHLIDISSSSDVWKDYQLVRAELRDYSKELVKKKEVIVLTKVDLLEKAKVESAVLGLKNKRKKVVAISTVSDEGLEELIGKIFEFSS